MKTKRVLLVLEVPADMSRDRIKRRAKSAFNNHTPVHVFENNWSFFADQILSTLFRRKVHVINNGNGEYIVKFRRKRYVPDEFEACSLFLLFFAFNFTQLLNPIWAFWSLFIFCIGVLGFIFGREKHEDRKGHVR